MKGLTAMPATATSAIANLGVIENAFHVQTAILCARYRRQNRPLKENAKKLQSGLTIRNCA
jgi:hypothetical protein